MHFNPRSLAGATRNVTQQRREEKFQSTLPRGSDWCRCMLPAAGYLISIHAPSRERHLFIVIENALFMISIHAPSRERPVEPTATGLVTIFQSTLPRGSDADHLGTIAQKLHFNPRSLAGATAAVDFRRYICLFQSTLPRGSDCACNVDNNQRCKFQSTLPRGSDQLIVGLQAHANLFQSTLPRGSDRTTKMVYTGSYISIHAPSRERLNGIQKRNASVAFQSTLPRGSDAGLRHRSAHKLHFNPRSLAGATIRQHAMQVTFAISIHAPSRERRR